MDNTTLIQQAARGFVEICRDKPGEWGPLTKHIWKGEHTLRGLKSPQI